MSDANSNHRPTKLAQQINSQWRRGLTRMTDEVLMEILRPPRPKASENEAAFLDKSTRSWIHVGEERVPIRIYSFEPRQSKTDITRSVILSPGYGLPAFSLLGFVPKLLTHGFRVVLFDPIAHGESGGDHYILDIVMGTNVAIAKRFAPIAGIIGFSLGGSAMLASMMVNSGVDCPKIVCINPPMQGRTVFDASMRRIGIDDGLKVELRTAIYDRARAKNFYLPEDLRRGVFGQYGPSLQAEVLLIWDKDDTMVSHEEVTWLKSVLQGSRLEYTKGLKHFGGLKDPKAIDLATAFIASDANERGSAKL